MKIKLNVDRALSQMDKKTRAEFLSKKSRQRLNHFDDILAFKHYFSGYKPKPNTLNGPEIRDSKLYISVYHYLEYLGKDPREFDTQGLGEFIYNSISKDTIPCFYFDYPQKINKYDLSILVSNSHIFDQFKLK